MSQDADPTAAATQTRLRGAGTPTSTYTAPPVERAIAVLKVRWRALKHVTFDPMRIGTMTAAAPVLTRTEKSY